MRHLKRILRIVRGTALGLSTLLLAATTLLWIRSAGQWETWTFRWFAENPEWTLAWGEQKGIERDWQVCLAGGRIGLVLGFRGPWSESSSPRYEHRRDDPLSFPTATSTQLDWCVLGLGSKYEAGNYVSPETGRPNLTYTTLVVPLWMLAVVFGIWPFLFAVRQLLKRKRFGPGCCVKCGYDLRATPERCPECGTVVKPSSLAGPPPPPAS